jgi:hypothetical protein
MLFEFDLHRNPDIPSISRNSERDRILCALPRFDLPQVEEVPVERRVRALVFPELIEWPFSPSSSPLPPGQPVPGLGMAN